MRLGIHYFYVLLMRAGMSLKDGSLLLQQGISSKSSSTKRRYSFNRRLLSIATIPCVYLWIYFFTNTIIDWDDPSNWAVQTRSFHSNELARPHFSRSQLFNCSRMLQGNKLEIHRYRTHGRYIVEEFPYRLPMSCESIRHRVLPNRTIPYVEHPYAISRVVNRDYYGIEVLLSQTYSPQNSYCYSVDQKSSERFLRLLKHLEGCFDNIVVVDKRFSFDSSGHHINYGHWECTKELVKRPGWKYILWLQNHDILLRTNQEMSHVIGFMNGSQAIGHKPAQWKRYNVLAEWTASALQLWKDDAIITERQRNAKLVISQNYNEVFLSRELLEFVIDKMNIHHLMDAFEQPYRFATDELLWATLIASTELELPGQPMDGCHDNRHYITRYNEWLNPWNGPITVCKSEFSRHGTCIFGVEYLHLFADLHQLAANKIMPSFDYAALVCYGELLFNRTYLGQPSPNSMNIYTGTSKNFC